MHIVQRFAWLSVAMALVNIGLKTTAWYITGSVGLLSDAAEGSVNLVAALLAVYVLRVTHTPADDDHEFGHSKAEYFSSGIEGAMILAAAGFIIYSAVHRIFNPAPVEAIGLGLAISLLAAIANAATGLTLIRAGRKHRSITLAADGKHLMTDVWTSVGVAIGVCLVWLTGWLWLDPVIAIAVALNILFAGWQLGREAVDGLMDKAMEGDDRADVDRIIERYRNIRNGVDIHEVRTRVAGRREFIEFHFLVPGYWDIVRGHDLLTELEDELRERFPGVHISSHLEPIEDERAYGDVDL
ncbi:cation diffusion facilitator family transporter [Corynebacterium sp. TAE3-ERU12]|uniref:cation diffusion facilitator family transporter n=1 Tax=Corynebacterium sp. TAE3-ERU12 TaxID=2849491 RepID=UPI001C48C59F|nr:cation diffusion facilitator family transporter [Corynebacterium sp. TAE3-ERU12]MBV7294382.1 cation diffusion facilitator family transporter [Corynebacterium sp. TAE3-ERU12]